MVYIQHADVQLFVSTSDESLVSDPAGATAQSGDAQLEKGDLERS